MISKSGCIAVVPSRLVFFRRPTNGGSRSWSRRTTTASPLSMRASSKQHHRMVDTELLRTQLDQLHTEAESARAKASSTRLRLMRLTEAAENLQKCAANNVLLGKESEARELLIQKKRLMQALEKSKNRIEVLDKLTAKINEAISLKESQLIDHVAMQPEVSKEIFCQQIHFVSPKNGTNNVSNRGDEISQVILKQSTCQKPGVQKHEARPCLGSWQQDFDQSASISMSNFEKMADSSEGIPSHEDLLEHMDMQLRVLEKYLENFLRSQSVVLEREQKQLHTKSEKILHILKDIVSIRERIASMMETEDVS